MAQLTFTSLIFFSFFIFLAFFYIFLGVSLKDKTKYK
jgi:hypothetical protein